jgi:hypothetical protein
VAIPFSGISFMQWIGMKLESFDGSGSPVDAAYWLTYVEDKMDIFEVVSGDHVCYGTQLLMGRLRFGGEVCRVLMLPLILCRGMSFSLSLRGGFI